MFNNILIKIGAYLWENNGFWINKEEKLAQCDWDKLPILGKIGYLTMVRGFKNKGIKLEDIHDKCIEKMEESY